MALRFSTASCLNTGLEINLEWKRKEFISVCTLSSRQYAHVPHAIAQFVLTIAKFIRGGLSCLSKCYLAFCTVSVCDYGVCFRLIVKVRSF